MQQLLALGVEHYTKAHKLWEGILVNTILSSLVVCMYSELVKFYWSAT